VISKTSGFSEPKIKEEQSDGLTLSELDKLVSTAKGDKTTSPKRDQSGASEREPTSTQGREGVRSLLLKGG